MRATKEQLDYLKLEIEDTLRGAGVDPNQLSALVSGIVSALRYMDRELLPIQKSGWMFGLEYGRKVYRLFRWCLAKGGELYKCGYLTNYLYTYPFKILTGENVSHRESLNEEWEYKRRGVEYEK